MNMRELKIVGRLLLLFSLVIGAQWMIRKELTVVHAQPRSASLANPWHIKPQLLTVTTPINVCNLDGGPQCGRDVYACGGDANVDITGTKITISDNQPTPRTYMKSIPIAPNSNFVPLFPGYTDQTCRWFPGGLVIKVDDANVLTIYLSGKSQ